MIDELHITDVGVIEDVTLRLAAGLTVVTGETGAGKTMVVTALEQLLGARADSALVRAGAEAAHIEARLAPPPPSAAGWLDGEGGDELVVAREIPADGRSRARINGRLATVGALAEVVGSAVEVHGQHEHVSLARPAVQRELLDRFAGEPHARVLDAYRDAYRRWRAAEEARERLADDARERARELDRLRFELREIDAAALDPEVDGRLEEELALLEHAEELRAAALAAVAALGDGGARDPLGVAVDALRQVPVADERLLGLRARAEGLAAEAGELVADARAYAEEVAIDPLRLEELRERRRVLRALARKYGPSLDDVLAYAGQARVRAAELERADAEAGDLDERCRRLAAEVERLAADVRRGRRTAAGQLTGAVEGHLAELGMRHARFAVEVEPRPEPGPDGADRVRFLLAPNPGEPQRSVGEGASGGERARVALAIEVALADVSDVRVLVFDEVDAGVGGATAMAVGEKLARLARGRQVLCVTHLPQLAAFADVHHVVEKGVRDGRTVTTARQVAADDRVAELSRMLSGDATRVEAREHARALLDEAATRRAS